MITKEKTERKAETSSGIEMKTVFRPADAQYDYERDLADPGGFPFTRGPYPSMYRGRLWTMRQYAGYASASDTNARFRYLLTHGQTGLSVAFDLPTQMGYDSDHQMAQGEVGKVGVAIDTLEDMEMLFDSIPLDQVSTSMTINSTAAILLSMYIVVARKQGVSADKISGTIQNDILKEYIARGTYIYPPRPSLRLVTDIFAYCAREAPRFNTISISGYHIREAGSTAAQEIAFTLADAIAYVEAAIDRGLDVDEFAPRIAFFFNSHNQFLEEVAKFRAARRLWARIMTERFGARDPRSQTLRFHAQTAGSSLTAQQPEVNIVRTAIQALAAVLGGAQSLHTNSMDEALGLPTEEAARIALRTQQVIGYESGVADTADPLGGSFAVEHLTNEIERIASDYIRRIDEIGGMLRAIEIGYVQGEIEKAAYDYQRAVESGEQVVVGVNRFTIEEATSVPLFRLDDELERKQAERVRRVREQRDNHAAIDALDKVEAAARGDENLMPHIIQAVESYATLGEISDRLRKVFGEYTGANLE
jgi:methylmalonyl-CoA mutase N-terminal domain/subunit